MTRQEYMIPPSCKYTLRLLVFSLPIMFNTSVWLSIALQIVLNMIMVIEMFSFILPSISIPLICLSTVHLAKRDCMTAHTIVISMIGIKWQSPWRHCIWMCVDVCQFVSCNLCMSVCLSLFLKDAQHRHFTPRFQDWLIRVMIHNLPLHLFSLVRWNYSQGY